LQNPAKAADISNSYTWHYYYYHYLNAILRHFSDRLLSCEITVTHCNLNCVCQLEK